MSNQKLNIEKGTASFWIKENKVQFNDKKATTLFQQNLPNGNMSIIKDSDNKLKFFHIYADKGKTSVEYDVSNLNPNERHMIAVIWDVENKSIMMHMDGKQVAESKINYT